MPMRVRGSIFTDYGELYLNDPGDRKARQRMWGAGFGVTASIGQTFDARFSIGWALLDTTLSHAGGARAYFGVGAQF